MSLAFFDLRAGTAADTIGATYGNTVLSSDSQPDMMNLNIDEPPLQRLSRRSGPAQLFAFLCKTPFFPEL
jgi:hypothetical protein